MESRKFSAILEENKHLLDFKEGAGGKAISEDERSQRFTDYIIETLSLLDGYDNTMQELPTTLYKIARERFEACLNHLPKGAIETLLSDKPPTYVLNVTLDTVLFLKAFYDVHVEKFGPAADTIGQYYREGILKSFEQCTDESMLNSEMNSRGMNGFQSAAIAFGIFSRADIMKATAKTINIDIENSRSIDNIARRMDRITHHRFVRQCFNGLTFNPYRFTPIQSYDSLKQVFGYNSSALHYYGEILSNHMDKETLIYCIEDIYHEAAFPSDQCEQVLAFIKGVLESYYYRINSLAKESLTDLRNLLPELSDVIEGLKDASVTEGMREHQKAMLEKVLLGAHTHNSSIQQREAAEIAVLTMTSANLDLEDLHQPIEGSVHLSEPYTEDAGRNFLAMVEAAYIQQELKKESSIPEAPQQNTKVNFVM